MSSYRPRTPSRSTIANSIDCSKGASRGDGGDSVRPLDRKATPVGPTYVPHVFDLVYPARDAVGLSEKYIPPVFLEAETVDSSVLLGHGASFTASLQKIPEGPKTTEVTINMPGWTATSVQPAPSRPSYLVYKTARIAFGKNGEPLPQYRRAMQSVLTEFHSLINPSLFKHPNVIDFLGIAWGSNPFSSLHKLPALVVEYADHGTLSRLLATHKTLDFDIKHLLCLDVARGLSALHEAGLVHGDIKADNVLIFTGSDRKFLAKISDFGFSIIAATESSEVWMGGTDPWRAPEIRNGPVKLATAVKTDVYSFGLLAWLIALNGQKPFDFLADGGLEDEEVELLKQNDALLPEAKGKDWLLRYLKAQQGPGFEKRVEEAATIVFNQQQTADTVRAQLIIMGLVPMAREFFFKELSILFLKQFSTQTLEKRLMRSLDDIFQFSLTLDSESRDLDVIVEVLESSLYPSAVKLSSQEENIDPSGQQLIKDQAKIINSSSGAEQFSVTRQQTELDAASSRKQAGLTSSKAGSRAVNSAQILAFWTERGFKKHWFSWQKTRELQPSVQNLVFDSFTSTDTTDKSPELFMICAYRMNGYGCKQDTDEALRFLQQAVALEHHHARAFMYRIWKTCRPAEANPGLQYLKDYAAAGSRPALADFEKSFPADEVGRIKGWINDATGGVGADWLRPSEMLDGHFQNQWIDDAGLMDKVHTSIPQKPLSQLIVNKRGDTVLHFVAMCGRWKPFKALILDYKMDINLRNALGETPLLSASRAGRGGIIILCLQIFNADASLAASNGETPLHWLVQFGDKWIEPIVKDMIARGANIDAATRERVSHSVYPGRIDVDFQLPGTALSWAVHHNRPHIVQTLLRYGASANPTIEGRILHTAETAAHYHHHECLEVIIDFLETGVTRTSSDAQVDKRYVVMFGPLVDKAEEAADKFSMILRGGADYLNRLHATLDLLREKSELANFQGMMQGSMLYSAVSKAHDEVVEYMFEKNWLTETINLPVGEARRTPVLEAIRWNRENLVRTLVAHGADIHALAANPFAPAESNWSALHIYAHEGHDRDLSLIQILVEMGFPTEGPSGADDTQNVPPDISTLSIADKQGPNQINETPFAVAIRHNAFNLADTLLSLGADANSLSTTSGLFKVVNPLTVLGHVIVSNARYCHARLNYLLNLVGDSGISFIVEPERDLTALHRCAMAHVEVMKRTDGGALVSRQEFDTDTSADIMYELLRKWSKPEEIDAKSGIDGNTALHLAVTVQNLGTVQSLLEAGASAAIENEHGETPLQLVRKIVERTSEGQQIEALLANHELLRNFIEQKSTSEDRIA